MKVEEYKVLDDGKLVRMVIEFCPKEYIEDDGGYTNFKNSLTGYIVQSVAEAYLDANKAELLASIDTEKVRNLLHLEIARQAGDHRR